MEFELFTKETTENKVEISSEEKEKFASQIKKVLELNKLIKMGFSEQDILALAGLENNLTEDLKNPDNSNGMDATEFGEWKEDIIGAINSVNDVKTNKDKIIELLTKNHKPIKAFSLGLYFSTLGSALADDLEGNDMQVEFDNGEKISFDELTNNPEFKEAMENNKDIPVDILQAYATAPLSNEEDFAVSFVTSENNKGEKEIGTKFMGTYHVQGDTKEVQEDYKKMTDLIQEIVKGHASSNMAWERITMEEFQDNKEEITKEIASIMNISEKEVSNYFEKIIEASEQEYKDEKVSAVSMEDWDINKELQTKGEITLKYEELKNKYNFDIPEEKEKAINEFEEWGKENEYDNIYSALGKEELENPFSIVKSHETIGVTTEDVYAKMISDNLNNKIEEKGFDLKELNKDPEKAFSLLCEIVAERKGIDDPEGKEMLKSNLEDWWKANDYEGTKKIMNGEKLDRMPAIVEDAEYEEFKENFQKMILSDLENNGYDLDKLNEIANENPKEIINILSNYISSEYGNDKGYDGNDRSSIFMGAKGELEKAGVPNLDKFAVIQTSTDEGRVSTLITVEDKDKIKTASISFHSIGNEPITEEKAHNSVLDKIKELNLKERIAGILDNFTKK